MCQNNTQGYFKILDFPGGTVDKNSPVNAENTGIPHACVHVGS